MKGFLDPVQRVCVCRFATPANNFWTPALCSRIQLNSDTVYSEIESDSTGKGLSPIGPPSGSDDRLPIGGSIDPFQLRMPVTRPDCYLYF